MSFTSDTIYFESATKWREWLAAHHQKSTDVVVGFYKQASGHAGMTWSESVDEALCYGWIDAVRRRIDDSRYCIRFCPRKATSIWSKVNIAKAEALISAGRMTPAGLERFQQRSGKKSGVYSFEQVLVALDGKSEATFKKNKKAWTYFQNQPPGYRRLVTWRVVSAKRPETRKKRLDQLIAASARGERLD